MYLLGVTNHRISLGIWELWKKKTWVMVRKKNTTEQQAMIITTMPIDYIKKNNTSPKSFM